MADTKEVDFLRLQVQALQDRVFLTIQHQENVILGLVNHLSKQQPDMGVMMAPLLLAMLNPDKKEPGLEKLLGQVGPDELLARLFPGRAESKNKVKKKGVRK